MDAQWLNMCRERYLNTSNFQLKQAANFEPKHLCYFGFLHWVFKVDVAEPTSANISTKDCFIKTDTLYIGDHYIKCVRFYETVFRLFAFECFTVNWNLVSTIEVGCAAKLFQRPFTKPPILKRELVLGAECLKLPSCLSRIHSK